MGYLCYKTLILSVCLSMCKMMIIIQTSSVGSVVMRIKCSLHAYENILEANIYIYFFST